MSIFHEVAARAIRAAGDDIVRAIESTPPDMQVWKPLDNGRTLLDQLTECTAMNIVMAQTFTDHELPPWNSDLYKKLIEQNDTTDKKLDAFKKSVVSIADAVNLFAEEHLDDTVTLPVGEGTVKSYAELAMMILTHMSYHSGQMNYVQTLYGDREMH